MDEYYQKYAKPLGKLSMFDLRNNLNIWRDNLKDELEGILYLRNGFNISNPGYNNKAISKIKLIYFYKIKLVENEKLSYSCF